jgi:vacuolar-type H+-ATPase subunit H
MEKLRVKEQSLDILRMLENLHEVAVEKPRTLFGPLAWGVNKEEIAMQIAKIRASLPNELKQAVTVTRESERIVENAKEDALMTIERAKRESERMIAEARQEADRIIDQARLQQEHMIAESELVQLATQKGNEVYRMAEREATHIRRGAEGYAVDVLTQVESVVSKIMSTIERGKAEMQQRPRERATQTQEVIEQEDAYASKNGHREVVGVS